MSDTPPVRAMDNRLAVVAFVLGLASLPGALTVIGGIVLGLAAVIAGFAGVARSHRLGGAGAGVAAWGIGAGMFGMAFGSAIPMFLS